MAFSETLRKYLDLNNMKAADLARATGLSEASISDYLKGKKEPRGKQSIDIAKALRISLDTLWDTGFDVANDNKKITKLLNKEKSNITPIPLEDITAQERNHFEKYRTLDVYGRKVVDTITDIEHDRMMHTSEHGEPIEIEELYYYGSVSAGDGEYLDGLDDMRTVSVVSNTYTRKADYVLKVRGNSMQPRFNSGDILLVKEQDDVDFGDIGIWTVNNHGYVKQKGEHYLISLNPNYEDIHISEWDEYRCSGKVIGTLDPTWLLSEI